MWAKSGQFLAKLSRIWRPAPRNPNRNASATQFQAFSKRNLANFGQTIDSQGNFGGIVQLFVERCSSISSSVFPKFCPARRPGGAICRAWFGHFVRDARRAATFFQHVLNKYKRMGLVVPRRHNPSDSRAPRLNICLRTHGPRDVFMCTSPRLGGKMVRQIPHACRRVVRLKPAPAQP